MITTKHAFIYLLFITTIISTWGCTAGSQNRRVSMAKSDINTGYRTRTADEFGGSAVSTTAPSNHLDLTDHLRKLTGVKVTGSGATAKVSIRANDTTTFTLDTAPLFVINGSTVGNNYAGVYQMINVDNIKSITVLKDNSSTSIYGRAGVNGVILIKLK